MNRTKGVRIAKKVKNRKASSMTFVVETPNPPRFMRSASNPRVLEIDFRLIHPPLQPNLGGTPPKYKDALLVQGIVDGYFASCEGVLRNAYGKPILDSEGKPVVGKIKPYTISGLAYALGIKTEVLQRYAHGSQDIIGYNTSDPLTSAVLQAAKQRIEIQAETQLYDRNTYNGGRYMLDSSFKWGTSKEKAEIKNLELMGEIKKAEHNLKMKMLELGEDDTDITINIVRKKE